MGSVDLVNEPPHYNKGEIETIDYIVDVRGEYEAISYCHGNVIKYTGTRLWEKGKPIEDAKKAKRDAKKKNAPGAPKDAPRAPKATPRAPQRAPGPPSGRAKMIQKATKGNSLVPLGAPGRPKSRPRGLRRPFCYDFRASRPSFWHIPGFIFSLSCRMFRRTTKQNNAMRSKTKQRKAKTSKAKQLKAN